LEALSSASGRDLSGWAQAWLRTAQVNTLTPEVELTSHGRYALVRVVQSAPPSHPTLRPHRIRVGRYVDTGETVVRRQQFPVDLDPERDSGRTTVAGLVGMPPGLLIVNDDDLTYAKLRLEPGDLAQLPDLLPRVADPLARALLWNSAWGACRAAEQPADWFGGLAAAALPAQPERAPLDAVPGRAWNTAANRYLAPPARDAARAALAEACQQVLAAADHRLLAAARGRIRCAGADDVAWLERWLAGEVPSGLTLDADLRWLITWRLAVLGVADDKRISAEEERDRSARGVQEATRCRAARPDQTAKEDAWLLVMTDRQLSNRIVMAAADGFWQPEHAALTAGYEQRFFDEIDATAEWRSEQMLAAVALAAYPSLVVEPKTVAAAEQWLARSGRHPILRREILDATDDLRRALAARALVEPQGSRGGSGDDA